MSVAGSLPIKDYWSLTNIKRMKLAKEFAKQHNLKPADVFMMLERITPPPALRAADTGLAQTFALVDLVESPEGKV